jgi:hypothetical protein
VKLACVVAAAALVDLVIWIPTGPGGGGILRSSLAFILILLGARVFRGPDEDDSPRAWWRMTSRVRAGVVLGSVCALVAFISGAGWIGLTSSTFAQQEAIYLPVLLINTVLAAILAYLYFGSSRRLVLARRAKTIAAARKGR